MIKPDAVYALAVTPGLVATGYQARKACWPPRDCRPPRASPWPGGWSPRGRFRSRLRPWLKASRWPSLAAAGETRLVIEAAGGAEAEALAGPPGWIVGAVVLVTAGGLLLTAYLLSDKPKTPTPQPQPAPGPAAGTATAPLVRGPAPNASAAPATQPEVRKYPGQLAAMRGWRNCTAR